MLDTFQAALAGQYAAALSMFHDCVSRCPPDKWEGLVGNFPFWHVAYHTLFYTDLYLSADYDAFVPPDYCRENYQYFGHSPSPPHEPVVADEPYTLETILTYIQHCREKASRSIQQETVASLAGPSGFWWYKIPRSEFHLNNIRHIQHHAAQMSLYLRREAGIEIDWVGTKPEDENGL